MAKLNPPAIPSTGRIGPPVPRQKTKRLLIGLVVDSVYAHGRGILRGITTYGLSRAWQFRKPADWFFSVEPNLHAWKVDGFILSLHDEAMVEFARTLKVPVVNISSNGMYDEWPSAVCGNRAIGRLAAEHFLDRGITNLAFMGNSRSLWSAERLEEFRAVANRRGATLSVCPFSEYGDEDGSNAVATALENWLAALPPQTGLFAANDSIAEVAINRVRDAGRYVPDDLAILGVDNDELTVQMVTPALSSIDANAHRIGLEAAQLLENLIAGKPAPTQPVQVEPIGVVARASTDILALADSDVTTAVRFIRDHAASQISVDDVLNEVPLSRRPLEKRFRSVLGRSILDEIHRVHVERASHLLVATDLGMPELALAAGFPTATRMGIVFKKITGRSPSEYRTEYRATRI